MLPISSSVFCRSRLATKRVEQGVLFGGGCVRVEADEGGVGLCAGCGGERESMITSSKKEWRGQRLLLHVIEIQYTQ